MPIAAPSASAHGPLHEQIAALTLRIEQQPRDAGLYLRRGELHAHHGDTASALADYDRAARLDPSLAAVDLARGRTWLGAGRLAEAKQALDRFLAARPGDPEALVTRARSYAKLGRLAAAAEDYTQAIRERETRGEADPDDYLERARVLAASGGGHLTEALRGLDEGIARLGPLASLELYALELELAAGRVDAALGRLQVVAAQSQRQEPWLVRQAEILERAGRTEEARRAYEHAVVTLGARSPAQHPTRAALDLARRASEGLSRLQARGRREPSP
jgi:tetratricopeptide (TPR) repeat protein